MPKNQRLRMLIIPLLLRSQSYLQLNACPLTRIFDADFRMHDKYREGYHSRRVLKSIPRDGAEIQAKGFIQASKLKICQSPVIIEKRITRKIKNNNK
jgi:hypothetical protein